MKRFAVMFGRDHILTFNNTEMLFKKEDPRILWVEQRKHEEDTVQAFERKFKVTLKWEQVLVNSRWDGKGNSEIVEGYHIQGER